MCYNHFVFQEKMGPFRNGSVFCVNICYNADIAVINAHAFLVVQKAGVGDIVIIFYLHHLVACAEGDIAVLALLF